MAASLWFILGAPRTGSAEKVKPTVDAYSVALPWYEREDFQLLWELAHDRLEMPGDYDVWHAAALSVINEWLSRGKALQIVTVRSDEFLAWLGVQGLPNTAATRLKYVEEKASGTYVANDVGVAAVSAES